MKSSTGEKSREKSLANIVIAKNTLAKSPSTLKTVNEILVKVPRQHTLIASEGLNLHTRQYTPNVRLKPVH